MFKVRDTENLAVRGLIYEKSDINKLKMFPAETLQHFIAKAIMFRLIRKKLKHNVISEFVITGCGLDQSIDWSWSSEYKYSCGVGDLLDLDTGVQYEIEFDVHKHIREKKAYQYKNNGIEIIVVHCNKLPRDIKKIEKHLKEYLVYDPIPTD